MRNKLVEWLSALNRSSEEIQGDLLVMNFTIVNAVMAGYPEPGGKWVLVDTGLPNSADYILEQAEKRFGAGSRPEAIILTHGHFDHTGSVFELADRWNVPVYIHELELPYVTGKKDYPHGDPTVDKGMVAKLSPAFPVEAIDISRHVRPLPQDGSVPGLPEWRWIHTPGHTAGHIALFRDRDRVLIAADALSTKQESLSSVMGHKEEISGPPKYLTENWPQAKASVMKLITLDPAILIASHGEPVMGQRLRVYLDTLAREFDEIALPDNT